jgi:hypothetical protein
MVANILPECRQGFVMPIAQSCLYRRRWWRTAERRVCNNKLITWDWDVVPTAVVIESAGIASSYKRFFEEKWKSAVQ